jgi:hypothetical protein
MAEPPCAAATVVAAIPENLKKSRLLDVATEVRFPKDRRNNSTREPKPYIRAKYVHRAELATEATPLLTSAQHGPSSHRQKIN